MANYIKNLETGKIELRFEKEDYLNLAEDLKKELKSGFLWSRSAGAWISRRKDPNLYPAIRTAKKLGFTEPEEVGEALSYAEQLERQAERAERRAERMEDHAENAERRAEGLQKGFNENRKDWSWLTQPNINSSAGRAFTNQRNRIMSNYDKGFEEYKKSDYFRNRAESARDTAEMVKLQDKSYLHNRIQECKTNIRAIDKNLVEYNKRLERIEAGEELKTYRGETVTAEEVEGYIKDAIRRLEYQIDKQAFMENMLESLGGTRFNKQNIKKGMLVTVGRWGKVEVIGTGTVNFTYKNLEGNLKGWIGKAAYAEIEEVAE